MRLAQVSNRVADLSEQYEVPEKLHRMSEKISDGMSVAGQAARQGALRAYHAALENPKTSIGGVILAAALVGGLLWFMFGDERRPVQRRRKGARASAGAERRKSRAVRRAAA
jgi:hypothetical protein